MKYFVAVAVIFTVPLLMIGAASSEELISEKTTCRSARAILDAQQPDMVKIREVFEVINRAFLELDRKNEANGRRQIYARMSDEGKHSTSALVTARCDDNLTDSLKHSSAVVYEGIDAMQDAMGLTE